MKDSVVTVFGGAGFVGRYVVRALAAEGARVRVACRRPDEALRCKPMGDVGQVVPVAVNVRDDASVAAALDGADAAVNLVGVLYSRGRQNFAAIHHEGAARIARHVAASGVARLVHISAIGADIAARSEYAHSKGMAEQAVREAFPGAVILRPSIVFGPEDDFFNRFAAMARLSPALPLIGGGRTRFQPVYACDVAASVVATLARSEAAGQTYELGGPAVHTFRELMEIMLDEIGRKRLLVPVPFWAATALAFFLEMLPYPAWAATRNACFLEMLWPPLLTRDQVTLLRSDNVATPGMPGLRELGISPTPLDAVLPIYLSLYRRGGRRGARQASAAGMN
jgi:uncharacterized protein YbjT (DUF2867 family)